jgi:hypothetical protein
MICEIIGKSVEWLKVLYGLLIKKSEPQNGSFQNIIGNNYIGSIGQSGGITAKNLNFFSSSLQQRQITSEQREVFANVAKLSNNNSCIVSVRVDNSNEEAVRYSKQIQEMIKNTPGWEVRDFGVSLGACDSFTDIKVGAENFDDPNFTKLISALKAAGIPFTTEKINSGNRIWVGSQNI